MYKVYILSSDEDIVEFYKTLKNSNYVFSMFQKNTISLYDIYKLMSDKVIYIARDANGIIAFIMFEYPYLNLIHSHCCFLGSGYTPENKSKIFKNIAYAFLEEYRYTSFIGYVPYPFKKTISFWKEYCKDWSTVIGEVPSGLIYNNEDVGGYIFHVQLNKESI